MSIFGDLDADEIPENPYWVEEGEYSAVITDAFFHENKKKEDNPHQLVICYTITDEDSEYFNNEVRDWFTYFKDMNKEIYQSLSAAEKKEVKSALSAIKRRLCGQKDTDPPRKGLGQPESVLNDPEWDPKELVGLEVDLLVSNSGDKNQYSNVRWANLAD